MRIGTLAKTAAVSKDTVRHYVELGLLVANKNPDNGYQEFSQTMLNRLRFIKAAQNLGFKLEEIIGIFRSADQSASPCGEVRDIIQRRISETREHILVLEQLCCRMEQAVSLWDTMPNGMPNGQSVCHLIETQLPPLQPQSTPQTCR
jgi:DNA-binding transcriptional MerR regulator